MLNGWQRLWVVIVLLSGIGTAYYTLKIAPDSPKITKLRWIKDASEVMAPLTLDKNNQPVTPRELRRGLYYTYKTQDAVIAFLEEIPLGKYKDKKEQIMAEEVDRINYRYRELVADPDKGLNALYIGMIIFWIVGSLVLYILGSLIGWVFRGFKK